MPQVKIWDRESATLGGRRGTLKTDFRIFESNIRGDKLRRLQGATDISVEMHNYREHAWELSLRIVDPQAFNPLTGFAFVELRTQLAGAREKPYIYPAGLYRFRDRSGGYEAVEDWTLVGRSLEDFLRTTYVGTYAVPKGAGVLNAARVLLMNYGIPASRINFPVEDVTLPNATFFDPIVNPEGSWALGIVNTLLNAGGFYTLYTDARGILTTKKLGTFERRVPNVFYSSHAGEAARHPAGVLMGEDFITTGRIDDTRSMDNFANVVNVVSQDTEETDPVYVTVKNEDPESPLSVLPPPQGLGYEVALDPIQLQAVSGPAEAKLIGLQALAKATGVYRTLSLTTLIDPRRGPKEMYVIKTVLPRRYKEEEKVPILGRFDPVGWRITEKEMVHELNRIELGYLESAIDIRPVEQFAKTRSVLWGYGPSGQINPFNTWGQDDVIFRELTITYGGLD